MGASDQGAAPPERTAATPSAAERPPDPVRIPNDGELPLQEMTAGPFAWRFAYARASERQAANRIGQDYLTFQDAPDRFAFALCDGVGQSYFGDLAARLLGDALLAWLWAVPSGGVTADDLGTELTAWLTDLTDEGTATVASHELQSTLAPMVAQVLERKRAEGSATTVTGARIEVTDDGRLRLMLVALGDSRLRVWVEGMEITVHSATSHVGSGWSTRRGIVGGPPSLTMFNSHVRAVRILAYSDGLDALDEVPGQLSSVDLQRMIEESQADPASDDIAVLDVWLRDAEVETEPTDEPDAVPTLPSMERPTMRELRSGRGPALLDDRSAAAAAEPAELAPGSTAADSTPAGAEPVAEPAAPAAATTQRRRGPVTPEPDTVAQPAVVAEPAGTDALWAGPEPVAALSPAFDDDFPTPAPTSRPAPPARPPFPLVLLLGIVLFVLAIIALVWSVVLPNL